MQPRSGFEGEREQLTHGRYSFFSAGTEEATYLARPVLYISERGEGHDKRHNGATIELTQSDVPQQMLS